MISYLEFRIDGETKVVGLDLSPVYNYSIGGISRELDPELYARAVKMVREMFPQSVVANYCAGAHEAPDPGLVPQDEWKLYDGTGWFISSQPPSAEQVAEEQESLRGLQLPVEMLDGSIRAFPGPEYDAPHIARAGKKGEEFFAYAVELEGKHFPVRRKWGEDRWHPDPSREVLQFPHSRRYLDFLKSR